MGPFEIGAIAIIGGLAFAAYEVHVKNKHRASATEIDALKAEIQQLKERVITLESIVTDQPYQLKEQINRL